MSSRTARRAAVALVLALGLAAAAGAQPAAVQVTGGPAEIRAQANPRGRVLLQAPEGTVLEVRGRQADWYRVAIPPGLRPSSATPATGYVAVRQVRPVEDPARGAKPGPGGTPARGRAAAARAPYRLRVFGTVGYERFAAARSFEAIYGSASAPVFGGGVDLSLGRSLFVQGDVSYVKRTGERAFVFEGEVFRLGIHQEMTLTPVGITVGYRRPGARRITPYAGGGLLAAFYHEDSALSVDEDVSKRALGGQVMAGAEFRVSRLFSAAVEAGYRYIPGILGDDGVSKEYGEKNIGGVTLGFKVLVGR